MLITPLALVVICTSASMDFRASTFGTSYKHDKYTHTNINPTYMRQLMLVKLMLSHQQVISLKFPGIAKWSDAIFPPGHDGHGGQEKYQKPKFP
jgi:hypothetical protein